MENTAPDYPVQWYVERIEYLSDFVVPERIERLKEVLSLRTEYMTICTENTFHPQNASALVRTCEAFGLQRIYTVEELCKFRPNVNIVRGSDKWVDIIRSSSTAEALRKLKSDGYRIIATTPHNNGVTPADFDIGAGPFAILLGTEHAGVSREFTDVADGFIRIPMYGFVDSLNVSACAAIVLYNLSDRLRNSDIPWSLNSEISTELLFRWLMGTIKDSRQILERFENLKRTDN